MNIGKYPFYPDMTRRRREISATEKTLPQRYNKIIQIQSYHNWEGLHIFFIYL